ncbi:type II toxin-antitoxin system RelE/ParE family toxin [Brevundimonas sp. NPDC092305]|uniref:type II toxin-antitoxin system RelE/ParE family toxin n=1 Tax=Brevundimonas sp. NPDC092305 TaxID=3363957 RepID=UPI0038235747
MRVVLTAPARLDLIAIGDWIAQDSPGDALKFISRLRKACAELSTLAHRYGENPRIGLRKRPVGNYLIFYRISAEVQIIRIIHTARDWEVILGEP